MILYLTLLFLLLVFGAEIRNKEYVSNLTGNAAWGGWRHTETSTLLYIVICAMITLMSGLRYYVGTDFDRYYISFDPSVDGAALLSSLKSLHEPGYKLITAFCSLISSDPQLPVFTAALIIITLSGVAIYRNSSDLAFSLLLYIFLVWLETLNTVRQALAVAVVFFGFTCLKDRKFVPFMICVFAAYLFHPSAIVMALVYFLFGFEINGKNMVIALLASLVMAAMTDVMLQAADIIIGKVYWGTEQFMLNSVKLPRVLMNILPAALAVYIYRGKELTQDEAFCFKCCYLHALLMIATCRVVYLSRCCWYTAPMVCICLPELLKGVKGRNRKILTVLILLLYGVFWLYDVYSHPDVATFQWVWQR